MDAALGNWDISRIDIYAGGWAHARTHTIRFKMILLSALLGCSENMFAYMYACFMYACILFTSILC